MTDAWYGLNLDALLPVDDNALLASGAEWFRAPLRLDAPGPDTVERLVGKGLKYLAVVDRTTVGRPRADYDKVYRATYPTLVAAVQIGNEWDHVGPSSWTMKPTELLVLRDQWQGFAPVTVMGGMADGRPEVLTPELAAAFDYWAFQPYGRRPEPAWPPYNLMFGYLGDLVDGYIGRAAGKPGMASEFGCTTSEIHPSDRPRWYAESLRLLLLKGLGAFAFGLNNGGGGGANAYHLGADELDAMRAVVESMKEKPVTQVDLDKAIDDKKAAVGAAIGQEYKRLTVGGERRAYTDAGILVAVDGVPGAYLLEDGPKAEEVCRFPG